MHFEFRLIIEAALVEVRDLLSARLGRELLVDELALLEVEIATPPPASTARLCTNAPFTVAAYCNEEAGKTLWQPAEVAGLMIDALDRVEIASKMYFDCYIGGPGHINAEVSSALGPMLLSAMNKGAVFPLHERVSLFEEDPQSDLLTGELIREYQSVFKNWWPRINPDQFSASELQPIVQEAETVGPKGDAARMQLLSQLADVQLEAKAFLAGVGGKENIPWYLDRFLDNSHSYLKRLSAVSGSPELSTDCSLWCGPAIETVLCTRYEFQRAAAGREPARIMRHLLSCIHGFYRFYNHPSFRSVNLVDRDKEMVCQLSRALNLIVHQGIQILGFL